jgi:hypothetical protein
VVLPTDPLERVRTGMLVVDAGGQRLGHVARVQLPPPPVTHPPASDIIDDMATLVPAPPEMSESAAEFNMIGTSPVGHDPSGLPDLPDELREHLEEVGFIEVEGSELRGAERFVAGDHIEEVRADAVVVRAARA